MADELFELKNYFHLGNFASAVTEGETVHVEDERCVMERDIILKRILYAQGKYDDLIASISDDAVPALLVVKLLALHGKGGKTGDDLKADLLAMKDDEISAASPCFLLMCAIGFTLARDYDNALRTAHRAIDNDKMEAMAIKVQVLVMMDRLDVADKECEAMQSIDEDHTLTQLATAWTHVSAGGDRVQEALYIFQDLLERHGATDAILNGIAACHIAAGKSDDAERVLSEALTKNPNCDTSLVNVICSSAYRNKPTELIARYFTHLGNVAPQNEWFVEYKKKEAEFDRLAQELTAA